MLARFVLVHQLKNLRGIGHQLDLVFPVLPFGYGYGVPHFLG